MESKKRYALEISKDTILDAHLNPLQRPHKQDTYSISAEP